MRFRKYYREGDARYITYHDTVWGVPIYDDGQLFAELMLRCIGNFTPSLYLQWSDGYRESIEQYDPYDIDQYERSDAAELRGRFGRQRGDALLNNVRCYFSMMQNHGSFSAFLWGFVNGQTIHNQRHDEKAIPLHTNESGKMCGALRKYGFQSVSSTDCYAFMQAVGMVNDHLVDCFRYQELKRGY